MTIRLGIVGISDGNGHPYSWSAICNGYESKLMEDCGFPAIPRYLEAQKWPEDKLPDAEVFAIWTQSKKQSEHIAACSKIPVVCQTYGDLIGQCDGVLLARDDAENHWNFVEPVLKAGKPIYIDKPAALTVAELDRIYQQESFPGQVFTCSALRYAKELELNDQILNSTGPIHSVTGVTPKSWAKYGIHVIEPILKMLSSEDHLNSVASCGLKRDGGCCVVANWTNGMETIFHAVGTTAAPLKLVVHGEKESICLPFNDPFGAFRAALAEFVKGIQHSDVRSPGWFNRRAIDIVEQGLKR